MRDFIDFIDISEWEDTLKSRGVQVYLPKWLEISKDELGLPDTKSRLYSWQFHIFFRTCTKTTIAAGKALHFLSLLKGRVTI